MDRLQNETYIKLNDGRSMPLLGLGTWQSPKDKLFSSEGHEQTVQAVEAALTAGYRHIDTAYNYLNEAAVGDGVRAWIKKTGGTRSDVFIVTKLPFIGNHPDRVEPFIRKSLKNFGFDYVDLYLIHLPIGLKYKSDDDLFPVDAAGQMELDFGTDHIAIWKEMVAVKDKGLAKSIGVSNFNVKQLRRLLAQSTPPPAVNQVEMHVYFQQPLLRQFCAEAGVALCGYGNFGSPGRRGTFAEIGTEIPNLMGDPVVLLVAKIHKVDPAHVLLRFWVQQGIAVLPKSTTPSRIVQNSKIFGWSLTETEMSALASLDKSEDGRTFRFLKINGMELHPECPAPVEK